MDVRSVLKARIGLFSVIVGGFLVFLFIAVLPASKCTTIWSDGELVQNSCQEIYYNIASYSISGGMIGWMLLSIGVVFALSGFWVLWRTIQPLSSDSKYSSDN